MSLPIRSPRFMSAIITLMLVCRTLLLDAADVVTPRKGELSSAGVNVTVPLDALAHDLSGLELPIADKRIAIGNIPFDLVSRPDADNLFLKSAEWPDWKADPSSYYSAYDKGPETPGDPRRPLFKIPVGDYSAVYLLAACENDPSYSQTVSFRIGAMDGARRVTLHDFSAVVPRFNETKKRSTDIVQTIPVKQGNLFVVRVPLGLAFAQDFDDEWAFDVEVTKELHLAVRRPDPCRYQIRPIGLPSGVHIYGMTLQRAPVQMKVTGSEPGHVFNRPDAPTFRVDLATSRKGNYVLETVSTDYYGQTTTTRSDELPLAANQKTSATIAVNVPKLGYHALTIRVMSGRAEVLRRETTFAVLPPDKRKHRDDSPFGTWDFCGGHFTPNDPHLTGPLYVKAGLRYGMFSYSAEERKQYGILPGSEPRSAADLAKRLEKDPLSLTNVLVFHEHAISGPHIMRTPDVFTGRTPYKLDENEQKRFDKLWEEAHQTAKDVRTQFPKAQLAFGNGNPHLLEEFLRHKFPTELFDSRGNECGSFMRMPETQPLDFVANNAGLWMDRQILDHYGYGDKPITQCYEVGYPCTNPGNLTLDEQANYFVRHMLHSLVWKIPLIRMGSITDMGNSYFHSNWGASGMCFSKPDVRPKPSYVAVATMTSQLDGAKFSRILPTGSASVYAVEFARRDGSYVTAIWTLRGTRSVTCINSDSETSVVDLMHNVCLTETFEAGTVTFKISPAPVFVSSKNPLGKVTLGEPQYDGRPTKTDKPFVVSPLANLKDWEIETARSSELEFYNFENPRRLGKFQYEPIAVLNGEKNALRVTPQLPVEGSGFLPMYAVLAHKSGIELPGEPTEIGLLVHGNSGWGRVMFELEDADGERFISIGAAAKGEPTRWMADWMPAEELAKMKEMSVSDWNTNDPRQRSRFNFDGWRFVRFPLPGQYAGEGYHWPDNSQWKSSADGIVKYPLKFKKLVLELPEKVLTLNEYAAPIRPDIAIKDLTVTYLPKKD